MANLQEFYNSLKADGVPVPDSYNEFAQHLSVGDNKEKFYNSLKADGVPVPDSYNEFVSVFGADNVSDNNNAEQPISSPLIDNKDKTKQERTKYVGLDGELEVGEVGDIPTLDWQTHEGQNRLKKKRTEQWQPTEEDDKRLINSLANAQSTIGNIEQSKQDFHNRQDNINSVGGALSFAIDGNRAKMGVPRVVAGNDGYLQGTYITPLGDVFDNKEEADYSARQLRRSLDMSANSQYREAERTLKRLKAKRDEALRQHNREARANSTTASEVVNILKNKEYYPNPFFITSQKNNYDVRAYDVAIREQEEALKNLAEEVMRNNGIDVGFWRGAGRVLTDTYTWDAGIQGLGDVATMMRQDTDNMTEAELEAYNAMMEAIYNKQYVDSQFEQNRSLWNTNGQMLAHMFPFMAEMAVTGGMTSGIKVFGKAGAKLGAKAVGKGIAEQIAKQGGKQFIKNGGKQAFKDVLTHHSIKAFGNTLDDMLIKAPIMANTVQINKTASNIIDRKLGDVVMNDNGLLEFENDKSWGRSIYEGEASQILEDGSEMFGSSALSGIMKAFGIGARMGAKAGTKAVLPTSAVTRVNNMAKSATADKIRTYYTDASKVLNKLGIQEPIEEMGEEVYNVMGQTVLGLDEAYEMNADGTRGKNLLATRDFYIDTAFSLALSMGVLRAGTMGLMGAQYARTKNSLHRADVRTENLLGPEKWTKIKKEYIDGIDNNNIVSSVNRLLGDQDVNLTKEQRSAIMDYALKTMTMRGFNTASVKNGELSIEEEEREEAFANGYNARSQQEMTDITNMLNATAEAVVKSGYTLNDNATSSEIAHYLNENSIHLSQEQKQALSDYMEALTVFEGMQQRTSDDLDSKINESNAWLEARQNRTTGTIEKATLKDDREVYIIAGNVGENASESLMIRTEEGKIEQISPNAVLNYHEPLNTLQVMQENAERITAEHNTEVEAKKNGTFPFEQGNTYTDSEGNIYTITANEQGVIDNGDGTVNVTDGRYINAVQKDYIQQEVDRANKAKVDAVIAEAHEAEQQAQQQVRPDYKEDDDITLVDDNGNVIQGKIADYDSNTDTFVVDVDTPIGGRYSPTLSRVEIEAMIAEHNGQPYDPIAPQQEQNTEAGPTEASEQQEPTLPQEEELAEQPTATEQVAEEVADPIQEQPSLQREQPTAISQIPIDEKGNPMYEEADADTAWSAIVEQSEGDVEVAQSVVNSMVADKEKDLKQAEQAKAKGGITVAEKIEAEKNRKAEIERAKQSLDKWKQIASTQARLQEQAMQARQQAEQQARKEQEIKEQAELETLNGVPDMVSDTPQDARNRGYRRVNGRRVDRQEPINAVKGKDVEVKFADKAIPKGKVAVIEADDLAPSHIQGQRNPKHFISEAQPKERTDEASKEASRKIAKNIRPEEITTSTTAYTGSPTVNVRGEVIQGNNRSDALKLMWESEQEQAQKYKDYLIEHAEEFGLDAEAIKKMKRPVLVTMVDATDAEAITLGQYVAQDTESGGIERIKPKNLISKMGKSMKTFANILLETADENKSFSELVDTNGKDALKWLNQKGYITTTQYSSAFDAKGNITAEAKNDIRGILYQSIFQNAPTLLEEMFLKLPQMAQRAILATAYRDFDSPKQNRMIEEIQSSIIAFYELLKNGAFVKATNYEDARLAVEAWKRQYQIDDATGQSYLPAENFSKFALELAMLYKGKTQTFIAGTFNNLYDLIQGTKEATLFDVEVDNTPRSLAEAIKEILKIDYNGKYGSDVLGSSTTTSEQGRQRSPRNDKANEQSQERTEPTDTARGTESNSRQSEVRADDRLSKVKTETERRNLRFQQSSEQSKPITKSRFERLIDRLMKTGLAKGVIVDAVKMRERLEQELGEVSFMKTSKGEVLGFVTKDGTIYLDPEMMNANTPIHEFGHLWNSFMKANNPELYEKGKALIRGTVYWERVNSNEAYAHLTEDQKAEEALAMLIGDKGEAQYNKSDAITFASVKAWLYDAWNWIKKAVGITSKPNIEDMTLEDFATTALADLLGGKELMKEQSAKQKKSNVNYNEIGIDGEIEEDTDIRFKVGKKARADYEKRLNKRRPDLSEEMKESFFAYLDTLSEDEKKLEMTIFHWFVNGSIILPEDRYKVDKAMAIAEIKKVNPMDYSSPLELIDEFKDVEIKEKPINPDTIKEFSNKTEYPDGVVVYDVENSKEGQQLVRRAIDTHWGEDANPWCLAARINGNLTQAWQYWNHYNAEQKKIAFQNGKLLAFCATNGEHMWWNRMDNSSSGIPIVRKLKDGKRAIGEMNEETHEFKVQKYYKGNKQNGEYIEWDTDNKIMLRENRKDGTRHGAWEEYYGNGQLRKKESYKNGTRHGVWEYYYGNGQPSSKESYKNGEKHGEWEYYYNGQLWEKGSYVDGKLHGEWERYHDNGQPSSKGNYKNGKKHGEWEYYYGNGQLRKKESYKNGVEVDEADDVLYRAGEVDAETETERFEEENGDVRYRDWYGGNSGYDGYSMSNRAVKAREEGRFPKTDFKKEYRVGAKSFDLLRQIGIIESGEWHHTSKYGNKTPFYHWVDEAMADFYLENKKEIDKLVLDVSNKIDSLKEQEREFYSTWKDYEYPEGFNWTALENRSDELNAQMEDGEISREERNAIINSEFPELLEAEQHRRVARAFSTEIERAIKAELNRVDDYFAEAERENDIRNRKGDGYGAYSDNDISLENDVRAKVTGKSSRTPKQRSEFADRERMRMIAKVAELTDALHLDNVEFIPAGNKLQGKQATAKGFYNKATGKITVILANHASVTDIKQTVFHEAVAHYGLRKLFGEHFDTFLDNVFENADVEIRSKIVDLAKKHDWNFRTATEEYLAGLAEETDFENATNSSWIQKVKELFQNMLEKLGLKGYSGIRLTDNELRYVLWRSYKNLQNNEQRSLFEIAEDVVMQDKLKVGNYAKAKGNKKQVADNVLFRKNYPSVREYQPLGTDERMYRDSEGDNSVSILVDKLKGLVTQANTTQSQAKDANIREIGASLAKLRKAMTQQKNYDKTTVKTLTGLINTLSQNNYISDIGKQDLVRMLSAISGVVGKENTTSMIDRIFDVMTDNYIRRAKQRIDNIIKDAKSKVNNRGVEAMYKTDADGRIVLGIFKDAITDNWQQADIEEAMAKAREKMDSENEIVANSGALEYYALSLVKQYNEDINGSIAEEQMLRDDLNLAHKAKKDGHMTAQAYREYRKAVVEAIRQNKLERMGAYQSIIERLGGELSDSRQRAKEWREAEEQRIFDIRDLAEKDMTGRAINEHKRGSSFVDKIVNSSLVQFFLSPLATFDQMLRLFGNKNVRGEGYLWNKFMRGWVEATENEYVGYKEAVKELDAKASSVFGKKMRWSGIFKELRKNPTKIVLEILDNGKLREVELSSGNLLYIYMVDKMADGQMKLRKMGITESDIENIRQSLDPRLIELADWIQEEFLPNKRNKYNEVHKRMFGTSMASIDNYFPLKILSNARVEEVDVADNTNEVGLPSTITGNIIKRRKNSLPLDILNTDAFAVILEHLQQMEHWASFAEYNRDINTLLSNKRFRNYVMNMTSVYGAGKQLWNTFRDVCRIAVGSYSPPKAMLDKSAVNIAKSVTLAKVSGRLFTAFKQLFSMPAYLSDSNLTDFAKGIVNPHTAWKWCMTELPIFKKRWQSRIAGDPRLLQTNIDWSMWRNNAVEIASRIGMSPNAFVDAVTVAIGTYSMYNTQKKKYIKKGYSETKAEELAKQDATILFNETQQSSEGAFLSAIQVDRSWLSVMLTIFRNSSMSYTRQLHDAIRSLSRTFKKGHKEDSIRFMANQMEADGIAPYTALESATKEYRNNIVRDLVRLGIFGFGIQLAWNLGGYLPYLLLGDDDDEKEKMIDDAIARGAFGSLEGLVAGDVMSMVGQMAVTQEYNPKYIEKDMPLVSDVYNTLKRFPQDKVSAMNDVINLFVQMGVGYNPQSLTDAVLGVMEYSEGDPQLTREIGLMVCKVTSCPPSQIDKIYFDEIKASAIEAQNMTPAEIAERYANYKLKRNAPLTSWAYDEASEVEQKEKHSKQFINEAKSRLNKYTDKIVGIDTEELDEKNKETQKTLSEIKKAIKTADVDKAVEMRKQLDRKDVVSLNVKQKYQRAINKYIDMWITAPTPEAQKEAVENIFELKSNMAETLQRIEANE